MLSETRDDGKQTYRKENITHYTKHTDSIVAKK